MASRADQVIPWLEGPRAVARAAPEGHGRSPGPRRGYPLTYEDSQRRVREFWGEDARNWERRRKLGWTDHPRVQQRINQKITGSPDTDRYAFFIEHDLAGRLPVSSALTLGCGRGDLERGLAKYDFCLHHLAFDVSEGAIETARELALQEGHRHISYEVRDLNRFSLPESAFDVIFGVSAVHHVAELELLFENVFRALRPGGCFYMDEFIGPSQFQWPDRQLAAINAMLTRIPEKYRVCASDGRSVRRDVARPTIAEMNEYDPSEAVRSAEIVPLLGQHFPDATIRGYGGTILQMLLAEIAGNFEEADPEANEWLDRIFAFEDDRIQSGELSHDFAVILARKPA